MRRERYSYSLGIWAIIYNAVKNYLCIRKWRGWGRGKVVRGAQKRLRGERKVEMM